MEVFVFFFVFFLQLIELNDEELLRCVSFSWEQYAADAYNKRGYSVKSYANIGLVFVAMLRWSSEGEK